MAGKKNKTPPVKTNVVNSFSSMDLMKDISSEIGGKNGAILVDLLYGKQHVNEFLIAKKLDLTINQTRNVLYKLSDEGLVSSVRKKDKKKGWYTYFWTFNIDKALILLQKLILRDIEQLEHQLNSRQQKRFYKCKICGTEVSEETALLHDFTCDECGEIYELSDSHNIINEVNSQMIKLKKKLESVQAELEIAEGKKAKKIEVENKKIEKEKADIRAAKKKERDKLKKKNLPNKVVKNKPIKKAKKKIAKTKKVKKNVAKKAKKAKKKVTKKKKK